MLRKLSWALVAFIAVSAVSWTADRPTAAHALSNCAVDDLTVDDEEQAFLRLINDYRARNNAPALTISPALTRAATWMAYDLSTRSGLAHSDSLGRSPWQRMPDCGYAIPGGENLAAGTNRSGAQWALDAWIASSSHRDVMLARDFATIGIARVYVEGSRYGWYWVTDFGYAGGDAAPAAPTPLPPAPTPPPPPPPAAPPRPAAPPPAPVSTASLAVSPGSNLITWRGAATSPGSAFRSVAHWVSVIYAYDEATGAWLRWSPALDPKLQTLPELRPGQRYWIIATRGLDVPLP
ncbi:MAG: CAP domain-containing protein [Chloroflexi bacterium]|nr:CAP domain-containing protein [Chloroflexota bacterium]